MNIAILGSTSHIARGLIYHFNQCDDELYLFSRSLDRLNFFIGKNIVNKNYIISQYENFNKYQYDVIINCIGSVDYKKITADPLNFIETAEKFDSLIIAYLLNSNKSIYINLSSGAAYLNSFNKPASVSMDVELNINNINVNDLYGQVKLFHEIKHRALSFLNIVDLRVFSYFSRFIESAPDNGFFLSSIINGINKKKEIFISPENIVRDYVHPADLFSLIKCCIANSANNSFDVYSLSPITKNEIIEFFRNKYNMRFTYDENLNNRSLAGIKPNYFSLNKKAESIGYKPEYNSLETIKIETEELLKNGLLYA